MTSFATPLIWVPGMPLDEVCNEIDLMIDRAFARDAWLDGEIDTEQYLDLLHDQGIDVFDLVDGWESGLVYI